MPPIEIAALGEELVGACRRQPDDTADIARGEPHAILHPALPMAVVAAAASLRVEQPAGHVGEERAPGPLFLELVEAAAAAAVAQALPFGAGHLRERLAFPERDIVIFRHLRSLAAKRTDFL